MPYPMIHFYIAKEIARFSLWPIKSISQFYLGTISPDAVQFRKTYDKKLSHLIYSSEIWGFVTDNETWLNDVIKFINKSRRNNNIDFIYGYGIHILADILNNIKIWTPFRIENTGKNFEELHKIASIENMSIDLQLYQNCIFKTEIMESLRNSQSFNFQNIISKEDMDKIKDNLINIQYYKVELVNNDKNKIVALEDTFEFINFSVENIIKIMKEKII